MKTISAASEIRADPEQSGRVWTDHSQFWTTDAPPAAEDSSASAADPETPPTGSTAVNVAVTSNGWRIEETLPWAEIVIAAQETPFAFLRDEPDLYTDADGEPV